MKETDFQNMVEELLQVSPRPEVLVSATVYTPHGHYQCGWEQGEQHHLHSPSTLILQTETG